VPHFMPAWLHKSATKAVTLSFQATRKHGAFEARDLETYRQMLPHISRALEIRDRLEQAQVRADTLARNLDTVSFGVAVLDSGGRLLEANAIVQALLTEDCGIHRKPDGALWLRDPAGRELSRWIASETPPAHLADTLLHVPRSNAPPLSVRVTPLPVRITSWIGGDPRWLLLIFDPDRRVHACVELIARDLGISAREAEVAALLVSGYNLHEVAQRWGVSEHTARAQLKSIFRKTGIRSQSDLVRRVALGPAMRSATANT
jgi:DNA-binding CsgD family transcriptional regulator